MSLAELLDQLSEPLREALKDGKRVTYINGTMPACNVIDPLCNELYPAVVMIEGGCMSVFVHKGDRFMIDLGGVITPEFSYDRTESEMRLFFQALCSELSSNDGYSHKIGNVLLVLGGITRGKLSIINFTRLRIYSPHNWTYSKVVPIGEPDFENDYLYGSENLEAYIEKAVSVAKQVFGDISVPINQGHWLEFDQLMRGISVVKSARSVVE
jgi:hypothetical protein